MANRNFYRCVLSNDFLGVSKEISAPNRYEYDIIKAGITADTLVTGHLDLDNQIKLNDAYISSYNGGYKIITSVKPIEDISITITYELSNYDLEEAS